MKSSDNPHKPGTQKWKDFEQLVIDHKVDTQYAEAKEEADARLKTAKERFAAEHEKGLWVEDTLNFLEGDEPEYDEVLDGPKEDNFCKSMINSSDTVSVSQFSRGPAPDPLNWDQTTGRSYNPIYSGLLGLYAELKEFPTICFPAYVEDGILLPLPNEKMYEISKSTYSDQEYAVGKIKVAFTNRINLSSYTNPDPYSLSYLTAEFYIRRALQ